jgi:replicative DNA helicase
MGKPAESMIPFSIDAEMGVLGSLIIDPDAIVQVDEFLLPEHFYRDAHQSIYSAILSIYHRQEVADFITLCDELERANKLQQVGGEGYIGSLINKVPTSGNIVHYAHILEKKWQFRQLIQTSSEIVALAYAEDETALPFAEERIYRLSQGAVKKPIVSHKEAVSRYMEQLMVMQERNQHRVITGVPTGFKGLDIMTGGLREDDLIILAARPAVGKTSTALNMAAHAVHNGYQVAFFSMEMSEQQIMQRWFAMEAGIDQMKLRDARLSSEEWEQLFEAGKRLEMEEGCLWIDDTCGLSSTAIRSKARRMKAEHGLDLIIVDYLQLGKAANENGQRYENRRLEVEEVCRSLKYLARELHVPVLSLAQLSRAVEARADKVPQLSDLREAGGIEADADIVIFIHKDPGIAKDAPVYPVSFIVEKHRNGPTGIVQMNFVAAQTKYYPIIIK